MSAGQTLHLLRRAAARARSRVAYEARTAGRQSNTRRQFQSTASAPTAAPSSAKGIQVWQAVLLGSLATLGLQGAILYANAPPSASSGPATAKNGARNLESVLEAIHRAGVETSTVKDVLQSYATAPGTSYPPSLPLAIAYPSGTDDVVQIVNACRESNVRKSLHIKATQLWAPPLMTSTAIIPISGRTSLEGQTLAVNKKGSAILVCLDKMNNILEVNEMNGDAVVQAVSLHCI